MRKRKLTGRRDFLKATAAGAASLALTSGFGKVFARPLAASGGRSLLNKWPGRVAVNFNKAALSGTTVNTSVVAKMVDDSMLLLTGATDIAAAWKAIFPSGLSPTSKIAIKVNTLNCDKPAPHWSSVKAMTDGLQKMDISGTLFPAANITIYDMNNGTPSENRLSKAGYNTVNFPGGINIVTDTAIDGGDGALENRKYAQTLKNADFLINVFGARGHDIPPVGSKFSLGFKSHFGTYFDPNGMHGAVPANLRAINATGPVFNKQVLNVCIGIFGTDEGIGPEKVPSLFTKYAQTIDSSSTTQCPTTIILSTDPISAEMQAVKILRMNKGGTFGVSDMPDYLKSCAGIDVANLTPTYDLGVIDEAQMNIRRMVNGVGVMSPAMLPIKRTGSIVWAHQIKGHSTLIDFSLPKEHIGKEALLEIFDTKGSLVRSFSPKVQGIKNHISWDERDGHGSLSAGGMYVIRLAAGNLREASQFSIVR
jgi:hypothetical protein